MIDRIDSVYTTAQSMAWDDVNSRFYLVERVSDICAYVTIPDHATTKTIWTHWERQDRSVACPFFDAVTADQNTQSQVGIGVFRKCRTAQFFIREGGIEPLSIVTAASGTILTNNYYTMLMAGN